MEQEIEFVSKINNELNINGKFTTIGDISIVFYPIERKTPSLLSKGM